VGETQGGGDGRDLPEAEEHPDREGQRSRRQTDQLGGPELAEIAAVDRRGGRNAERREQALQKSDDQQHDEHAQPGQRGGRSPWPLHRLDDGLGHPCTPALIIGL